MDIKHYCKKHRALILSVGAVLGLFAVLGMISGFRTDAVTLYEEGKSPVFVFVDEGKSAFVGNIYFSAILVALLTVATRFFSALRRFGFIFVGVKLYFAFRQVALALLVYGVKAFVPCMLILVVEICLGVALSVLYLLNVTDECSEKDALNETFLRRVVIVMIVSLVLCLILTILYNALRIVA